MGNMRWLLVFLAFTFLFDHVISEDKDEDEDLSAEDEGDEKDEGDEEDEGEDEEEYEDEGRKEVDYDSEYYDPYERSHDTHREINHHTTLEEARHWWQKLSPSAREKLAKEEHIKNEEDKRFQIYLKALILEAEK